MPLNDNEQIHQDPPLNTTSVNYSISEHLHSAQSLLEEELFDKEYYLDQYADVKESGMDPLEHYAMYGWRENRKPNSSFDPIFYKKAYKQLLDDDLNPLIDFLNVGFDEGRVTNEKELINLDLSTVKNPIILECYAKYHAHRGQWFKAEQGIVSAISNGLDSLEQYQLLSDCLKKQAKWWQRIECLESAIAIDSDVPELHYELGVSQEAMRRHVDAASSYRKAIALDPSIAMWHYRLGYVLENAGHENYVNITQARKAYAAAVEIDDVLESKQFGHGVFHQKLGRWIAAIDAYKYELYEKHNDADLHFKLGMAYDRTYQWALAANSYQAALSIVPDKAYWHYRLGFVYERLKSYTSAAKSYSTAAKFNPAHSVYWHYRCGYVYEKLGLLAEACEQYKNTLSKNPAIVKIIDAINNSLAKTRLGKDTQQKNNPLTLENHENLFEYGLDRDLTKSTMWWDEALNQIQENNIHLAKEYIKQAIARHAEHNPNWNYVLGYIFSSIGQLDEACASFRNIRTLQKPYGAPEDYLNNDAEHRKLTSYNEALETCSLVNNQVLYESFHGSSMSCNPLAIFLRLLELPEFSKYTHIWVIDDTSKVPRRFKSMTNVIFIPRDSYSYLRYLSTSKFLINNNTFPPYFIRREGQKYLNTWHGTPIKTLGKDILTSLFEHKNAARNFLQATDIIAPNEHTENVLLKKHDIQQSISANILRIGYPRIDMTLRPTQENLESLRNELGISTENKVFFYAPTYRGSSIGGKDSNAQCIIDAAIAITQAIGSNGVVFFKAHHMLESVIASNYTGINLLPNHIDTNQFLAITDVLITDYSSIAIDFMATKRPIVYYAFDYEEYKSERGLYFELEELGEYICFNQQDLNNALRTIDQNALVESSVQLTQRFCPYETGHTSDLVIDSFFKDRSNTGHAAPRKKTNNILAFAGALIPNGITTSLTNLTNSIDYNQYSFTIAVDPNSITNHPERVRQLKLLNPNVNVLARVGRQIFSTEEKWLNDYFLREHELPTKEMRDILNNAYLRENIRLFGRSNFHNQINFDGYIRFWAQVLSQKVFPNTTKNIAFLHNDMMGEWTQRFPNLLSIFNTYPLYDTLLSVSKSTSLQNSQNLAEQFSLRHEQFEFADNLIDVEKVQVLAEEALDPQDLEIFEDDAQVFINVARLSVEKGHESLINAFSIATRTNKNIKLVIVGDGPLKFKLQQQIQELNLEKIVFLLGRKDNPFKYLKKSDCFVFSSRHEGQGLAILEAMILKLPILCTNFPCAYDVLDSGRLGTIVGMTPEEICNGINNHLHQKSSCDFFDPASYKSQALAKFYEIVKNIH